MKMVTSSNQKYFPFLSSIEIIRVLGHIYHILFCIIIIIIAINDQA
jgi:hypothetical protein